MGNQNQNLFQDSNPEDRLMQLRSLAHSVKKEMVFVPFTQNQLLEMKDLVSEKMIEKKLKSDELKAITEPLKGEIKTLEAEVASTLNAISAKGINENQEVFNFLNERENRIDVYSREGILLYTRPILPYERQLTITESMKLASNQ